MCTARTKLKEIEQEMDCLYAELRNMKACIDQSMKETKAAEAESKRYADRCMRLTATADTAILWMMFAIFVATLSLGFMVHAL